MYTVGFYTTKKHKKLFKQYDLTQEYFDELFKVLKIEDNRTNRVDIELAHYKTKVDYISSLLKKVSESMVKMRKYYVYLKFEKI